MTKLWRWGVLLSALLIALSMPVRAAEKAEKEVEGPPAPGIRISEQMGDAMLRQAAQLKKDLKQETLSLFKREPLGWDAETLADLYRWTLDLPVHSARLVSLVIQHSRLLGAAGSLVMLVFFAAVLYSLIGQRRVIRRIEGALEPYREKIPAKVFPFLRSILRIVVAALIPLALLAAYSLVNGLVAYRAPWFAILGRLLILWAVGALLLNLLRESLTRDLFPVTAAYGRSIYRLVRLALLYAVASIALVWSASALQLPPDVLAFFQFAIALSIVVVLFLLHLNKKALLSLLPDLPYAPYRSFVGFLNSFYWVIIGVGLIAALLWCFGFHNLGRLVIIKIWVSGAVFVAIMMAYHLVRRTLQRKQSTLPAHDEGGQAFYHSLQSLLQYTTVLAAGVLVLNLIGLLPILQQGMSIPVLSLGETPVTLWTLTSALLIMLVFVFVARLLRAFLDYRVYPRLGVDQGLGYVLNTLFGYILLGIGGVISLRIVGMDLRLLLVFAGAVGIGVGLGLQNLAANILSGFTIIFGGKIRKGDWIEAESTLGEVTDIYLRATRIRTRDNVEYLLPNANLITNTIINYSLASPHVRIDLPVGVSYAADPRQVEQILLEAASREPLVVRFRDPVVRFVGYGESSIDFQLLFWIDIRATPRRLVRSNLYFAIFEALRKAGIEIPFPQRDLHLRSSAIGAQRAAGGEAQP